MFSQAHRRVSRNARTLSRSKRFNKLKFERLERRDLLATFTVSSLGDSGAGTLRQAILDANVGAGSDVIQFSVTGTIKPTSALPVIVDSVLIDGNTAPGFTGRPKLEIDGSLAGAATGLFVRASSSTIRGLAINNFSGLAGIVLGGNNNTVTGNFIGTNLSGTVAKPNARGILVSPTFNFVPASGNLIGGASAATRNVISGNTNEGILIGGGQSTIVLGNFIGTSVTGTAALPNGGDGVQITRFSPIVFSEGPGAAGSFNQVGGVGAREGNRIRNNGGAGVAVVDGASNSIRGNSILNQDGLGIDLDFAGVTPNDRRDPDFGPNLLQNYPLLGGVDLTTTSISAGGLLDSTPSTTFTIDLYASSTGDASGNGEGETYLGSTTTTTNSEGYGGFSLTVSTSVAVGSIITATATDPSGNTSEFSNQVVAPATNAPARIQFFDVSPHVREAEKSAQILVKRTGNLSLTSTVRYATSPDSALVAQDYTTSSGVVTFAPGEALKIVSVPLVNDSIFEGPERFDLTLSSPTNAAIGSPNPAEVVIDDDDLLDIRFDQDGKTTTGFIGSVTDAASSAVSLPGGKLVVGGTSADRYALAKYLADGSLDTSFGTGGRVTTSIFQGGDPLDLLKGLAVQSDGKILAVGSTGSNTFSGKDYAMVRYNANGTLDNTFGNGGIVVNSFTTVDFFSESAVAVAVQSDGKIVVLGATDSKFIVARYLSNGTLDTTFNTTGFTRIDFNGTAFAESPANLIIRSDGRIVVGGHSALVVAGQVQRDGVLARLLPNGKLDTSFSGDGKAFIGFTSNTTVSNIAAAPGNKIVLTGDQNGSLLVARLSSDGVLDTSFDTDGIVTKTNAGTGSGLVVQANGKISVTSETSDATNRGIHQFLTTGQSDTSFSGDGKLPISFDPFRTSLPKLLLDSANKLVAVGTDGAAFAVARVTTAGVFDTSFSGNGSLVTEFLGPQFDSISSSDVQSDGKLVVAGTVTSGFNVTPELAIVRYNTNGSLDTTFGVGGKLLTSGLSLSNGGRHDLAITSDDKIVVSARVDGLAGVIRLTSNGAFDNTFSGDGKVGVLSSSRLPALEIDSTGKLVLAVAMFDRTLQVARLTHSGVLDTAFDGDGIALTSVVSNNGIGLAIAPSNKIVVAGDNFASSDGRSGINVTRLLSTGALDTTFSGDGFLRLIGNSTDENKEVRNIAVQSDGKIVLAGINRTNRGQDQRGLLVRLNNNGTLDSTFGKAGQTTLKFSPFSFVSVFNSLLIQPDNTILVAGSLFEATEPFADQMAIARYTPTGQLDASFNSNGILALRFGPDFSSQATTIARSASGQLYVAGDSNEDFAVIRLSSVPDPGPFATLSLSAPSYSVSESAGAVTITVNRTGISAPAVQVAYSTSSLTATAGSDFTPTNGVLSFLAGETSKTFTVPVTNDTTDELNETFSMTLNDAVGAARIGGRQVAVVTIVDNDLPPAIFINDASITEGSAGTKKLNFTVSLSQASAKEVTVKFKTTNDTAVASSDFIARALTTMTFAPGTTTRTIEVTIKGDALVETNERFFIDLSASTNATIVDSRGIGTILNDDSAPPSSLTPSLLAIDAFFNELERDSLNQQRLAPPT